MPDHLLETKFHTPIWRSDGVLRPRLLDQLQAGLIEHRKELDTQLSKIKERY